MNVSHVSADPLRGGVDIRLLVRQGATVYIERIGSCIERRNQRPQYTTESTNQIMIQPERIEDGIERRMNFTVGKATRSFETRIVSDALEDALRDDAQTRTLVRMAVLARALIEERGYDGGLDPLQAMLDELIEQLERLYRRRRLEVTAQECASIVRQDDRWTDPEEKATLTDIHAMGDAVDEAANWLEDHTINLSYMPLRYPADEAYV